MSSAADPLPFAADSMQTFAAERMLLGFRQEFGRYALSNMGETATADIFEDAGRQIAVEMRATVLHGRQDVRKVTHTFDRTVRVPKTWIDHLKADLNGRPVWPGPLRRWWLRFVYALVRHRWDDPRWASPSRLARFRFEVREWCRGWFDRRAKVWESFWKVRTLSFRVEYRTIRVQETKTDEVPQTINICPHLPQPVGAWAESRYIIPRLQESISDRTSFPLFGGPADLGEDSAIRHLHFLARSAGDVDFQPSLVTRIQDILIEAYHREHPERV